MYDKTILHYGCPLCVETLVKDKKDGEFKRQCTNCLGLPIWGGNEGDNTATYCAHNLDSSYRILRDELNLSEIERNHYNVIHECSLILAGLKDVLKDISDKLSAIRHENISDKLSAISKHKHGKLSQYNQSKQEGINMIKTKSELKTGMIVQYDDGEKRIVLKDTNVGSIIKCFEHGEKMYLTIDDRPELLALWESPSIKKVWAPHKETFAFGCTDVSDGYEIVFDSTAIEISINGELVTLTKEQAIAAIKELHYLLNGRKSS